MITLPTTPGPRGASPGLIDFGGFLTPSLGGEVQRVNRMGSRYAIQISMPPMPVATGMIWVSRLIRGKSEGVRMEFPLLDFNPGTPGAPVVNGPGQSGSTIDVRGFAAGYQLREGQWFSLLSGGRHYLYNVAGNVTASGSGAAAVPISPMLRAEPSDADVLFFDEPMIEGFIHGDEWRWEMSVARHLGFEFEIREAA